MNLTILHLSDIQYGRHHVDKDTKREPLYPDSNYNAQLKKMIVDLDILAKNNVKPNFIVISGDIAETSILQEYKLAENFIRGIASHLKIDRRYVIMVPGNHDINWDLCKAARLQAKAWDKNFHPPYFEKFDIFSHFFNSFYKNINYPDYIPAYEFTKQKLFVNFFFIDECVLFTGFNSCIDECENPPHYGNITIEQIERAVEEVNKIDGNRELFRIAVMHHNFVRSSLNDDENLKDADDIRSILLDNGFKIILHGHQHMIKEEIIGTGNKALNVFATGSSGLDQDAIPNNSRRYQIIQIKDNIVRLYPRRFDNHRHFTDGIGCWTSDLPPDQFGAFIEFELGGSRNECIDTEFSASPNKNSASYDIYKLSRIDSELLICGEDILNLSYPKRKIELIDRVLNHKDKIYYEYLSVDISLNISIYFLFVGKNINISASLNHFIENSQLPKAGLVICTPRVKSKITGDAEYRAKNVSDSFITILSDKGIKNYKVETHFIDDFIWQNCLDVSITKNQNKIVELEYFIDQNIYSIATKNEEQVVEENNGLCLEFFKKMLKIKFEEDYSNPVTVILASGGMGKTTLSDRLVNFINSFDKRRAIYINSNVLLGKIDETEVDIKSITDLFKLYDSVNGNKFRVLQEPNSLEINVSCGNIIVVIDGLDEIESALKNKFDINNFLNSLVNLDDQFNNCKIIITSRDYHIEKYRNKNGINLFSLKGFDDDLTDQYFTKRFTDDKRRARAYEYAKRLNIKSNNFYMPLFLSLISEIVLRESNSDSIEIESIARYDSKYLKPTDNVLDDLIYRLLEREIEKQKLKISIDDFFDLLVEIVVNHKGKIDILDFNEFVDIVFPNYSNIKTEERYTSFYVNPLLSVSENKVQLKYDILTNFIKTRYFYYVLGNNKSFNNVISILAEKNYGEGAFIDELINTNHYPKDVIAKLKQMIKFLVQEIRNEKIIEKDKEIAQKALSFSLYFAFKLEKPITRKESTDLLKELFDGDLRNIYIYGDFYPLDFCDITIFDSYFDGYNKLSSSIFPTNKTVFLYCSFKNLSFQGNPHIPGVVFDESCDIPKNLKTFINLNTQSKEKLFEIIKNDLKKFLKSFASSGTFTSKSLNKIFSNYSSKIDRQKFIKEAIDNEIIEKGTIKRNDRIFYSVAKNCQTSSLSLINQNLLDSKMEHFCHKLLYKYYDIQ